MKIRILGAGALGCAIGGVLTEGGVDRVAPVHAATNCNGVSLTSGPVDLVVVPVKSFHTRDAMESARAILGDNTVVLSLQNGIGQEDMLVDVVGRARVMAGKTYAGGVMLAAGRVIVGTIDKETIIGELDGNISPRARRIADTFTRAGLHTTVSSDIMGSIWEKLLVNVATGALSGITRLPFEFKASMLQSLEKGSVTEIDFVNGAVVAQGRKLGVPTPVNMALVARMKGIEQSVLSA